MSNATIAYLGPQGTYSDEAARLFAKKMGCENPEFVECPSFNEVHEAVDRGRCEFGVMPIENSLEGVVTATLDTLAFKGGVSIMGSTVLNIHHCLMVNPESSLDEVTTIASHPQALAQCRRWLDAHFPSVPRLAVSSTAEGARKAAQDKTVAGISSKFAGQLFNCTIAEEGIEDHYGNQTRFVLIARQGHEPVLESDNMKTTLALSLNADKPIDDSLGTELRQRKLDHDPEPSHQARAGRLPLLHRYRRHTRQSCNQNRARLPPPETARSKGAWILPR